MDCSFLCKTDKIWLLSATIGLPICVRTATLKSGHKLEKPPKQPLRDEATAIKASFERFPLIPLPYRPVVQTLWFKRVSKKAPHPECPYLASAVRPWGRVGSHRGKNRGKKKGLASAVLIPH